VRKTISPALVGRSTTPLRVDVPIKKGASRSDPFPRVRWAVLTRDEAREIGSRHLGQLLRRVLSPSTTGTASRPSFLADHEEIPVNRVASWSCAGGR
jgi:hypothetical protein